MTTTSDLETLIHKAAEARLSSEIHEVLCGSPDTDLKQDADSALGAVVRDMRKGTEAEPVLPDHLSNCHRTLKDGLGDRTEVIPLLAEMSAYFQGMGLIYTRPELSAIGISAVKTHWRSAILSLVPDEVARAVVTHRLDHSPSLEPHLSSLA